MSGWFWRRLERASEEFESLPSWMKRGETLNTTDNLRCGPCGSTDDVQYRGWTDDGDPMPTCAACGAPDLESGSYSEETDSGGDPRPRLYP